MQLAPSLVEGILERHGRRFRALHLVVPLPVVPVGAHVLDEDRLDSGFQGGLGLALRIEGVVRREAAGRVEDGRADRRHVDRGHDLRAL